MQLFVLHQDPALAAELLWRLDPRRANKQILECCQCLAACGFRLPKQDGGFYGVTHKSHPVVKWMQQDTCHILWVIDFAFALASIYQWKYKETEHGCMGAIMTAKRLVEHRARPKAISHQYFSRVEFPDKTTVYDKYHALLLHKQAQQRQRSC